MLTSILLLSKLGKNIPNDQAPELYIWQLEWGYKLQHDDHAAWKKELDVNTINLLNLAGSDAN